MTSPHSAPRPDVADQPAGDTDRSTPAPPPVRGRPGHRRPAPLRGRVIRVEPLTPGMVRIVLGGEGLAGFAAGHHTDEYIKLLFPAADGEASTAGRPRMRTYTVRRWDPVSRELSLDFVVHGDHGLAGPWAARARAGDEILLVGPGGGYAPDPDAPWHLLVGDESALPAIAATLERLPGLAEARVCIEVPGPADELELPAPQGAVVRWIHRGEGKVGDALVSAVRSLDWPAGHPQVFVHGEAGWVREVRRLLLERRVPRERWSLSGYWRAGQDEDGWQAAKRDFNRGMEEDGPGPTRDGT